MNKNIWRIHSLVNLYLGVFIAFISFTGVVAIFKHEIDMFINYDAYNVSPKEEKKPYHKLIHEANTLAYKEGLEVFRYILPKKKTDPFIAEVINKGGKSKKLDKLLSIKYKQYFYDPYTGELLLNRDYYRSVIYFIRSMHIKLYDSYYGRGIVGIFGLFFLLSLITGIIIYPKFLRKRKIFSIRKKVKRAFYSDLHKLIGILALLFNLVIAITGAWLGIMDWIDMDKPNKYKASIVNSKERDAILVPEIEPLIESAKEYFPDMIPHFLYLSKNGESTATILGDIENYPYERHTQKIVIDKLSAKPIFIYDVREQNFKHKLFYVQEALHFGDFWGLPLKLIYFLFGFTASILSITGYYIYLSRIKSKLKKPIKKIILTYIYLIALVCLILFLLNVSVNGLVASFIFVCFAYTTIFIFVMKKLFLLINKTQ